MHNKKNNLISIYWGGGGGLRHGLTSAQKCYQEYDVSL